MANNYITSYWTDHRACG